MNVGLSDFKSRRHVIPRRNVSLFRELYVRLSPDAQYMARRWFKEAEYPDALIPFHDPYDPGRKSVSTPFNIVSGRNQPVWVDVRIPRDAPPGTYEARLVATARGAKPVEASVRLVV